VPQSQLRQRLKVEEYNVECPLDPVPLRPTRVSLKLRQHTGKTAGALVAEGAKVKKGQVIGRVEASALGADIHASIDGTVTFVSSELVKIEA
jgi:Na+-translocating ferredoxin:NAD+ oxidoreductase RnfC subunit